MFKLSLRSKALLEQVHPHLKEVVENAIQITKVDFSVIQGLRTKEQQAELYAQGRTKPGPVVTWTMNSRHLTGHAVDLCPWVNNKLVWDEKYYPEINRAMQEAARALGIPIEWGGNWKKLDLPHFELDRKVYV